MSQRISIGGRSRLLFLQRLAVVAASALAGPTGPRALERHKMRLLIRFAVVVALVLGPWAPPQLAHAANLDTTADRVFGQPNVTSNGDNNGGISATSLSYPKGAVLDAQGNLYVADRNNNRVLEYDAPLATDAANRVFGQPDLNSTGINTGGVSADSLYGAWGVAVDAQGNLYVADTGNSRLLEYDWASAKLYLPLVRR